MQIDIDWPRSLREEVIGRHELIVNWRDYTPERGYFLRDFDITMYGDVIAGEHFGSQTSFVSDNFVKDAFETSHLYFCTDWRCNQDPEGWNAFRAKRKGIRHVAWFAPFVTSCMFALLAGEGKKLVELMTWPYQALDDDTAEPELGENGFARLVKALSWQVAGTSPDLVIKTLRNLSNGKGYRTKELAKSLLAIESGDANSALQSVIRSVKRLSSRDRYEPQDIVLFSRLPVPESLVFLFGARLGVFSLEEFPDCIISWRTLGISTPPKSNAEGLFDGRG